MFHFFRDTQTPSPLAMMVFDRLGPFSVFSILKMCKKFKSVKIYYIHASSFGLIIIRILRFFGIALEDCCQIKDYLSVDTKYSKYFECHFLSFKICHANLKRIEEAVGTFFPGFSKYSTDLLVAGVQNTWKLWLLDLIFLQFFAEQTAKELNISLDRVVVVSAYASLMKELGSASPFSTSSSPIPIIQQPLRNRVIPFLCWNLYLTLRDTFFRLFYAPKKFKNPFPMIAVAAVWGIKREDDKKISILDDLVCLSGSGIATERLVYLYDRADFQPTAEKIEATDSLGIQSFVLDHRFLGNSPQLLLEKIVQKSFWASLVEGIQVLKWSIRALFLEALPQSIIAIGSFHLVEATRLAAYFKTLNIRGLIHYKQVGVDVHSLAAEFAGACRFGVLWSSLPPTLAHKYATPQVYFVWGSYDAELLMDSGCISKHLLIAGCLVDKPADKKTQKKYLVVADQVRNHGAKYVLGLFASAFFSKEFYLFFLGWLIEDPNLGLLIKSKAGNWSDIQADGLDGLVQRALKTGRVQIIDGAALPSEVATVVDFSIGIGTLSAVVVSALSGARVLFVDHERMDQGSYKNQLHLLLHSLGPNRCVFYDFDSAKKTILKYVHNPKSCPDLGDASPVINFFDPFRDGQARQRIGEYMGWYIEGLDKGLSRDDALCISTEKYAAKWGEDKVVRGLSRTEG